MIQDTSNGTEMLKTEIKAADDRLRAVKSGIPLTQVVPAKDDTYYNPCVDDYFRGADRIERNKQMALFNLQQQDKKSEVNDEVSERQVKFFITE